MTLASSFLALLRSSSMAREAATSCGDELTLEVVDCAQPIAAGSTGEKQPPVKRGGEPSRSTVGNGEHERPSSID